MYWAVQLSSVRVALNFRFKTYSCLGKADLSHGSCDSWPCVIGFISLSQEQWHACGLCDYVIMVMCYRIARNFTPKKILSYKMECLSYNFGRTAIWKHLHYINIWTACSYFVAYFRKIFRSQCQNDWCKIFRFKVFLCFVLTIFSLLYCVMRNLPIITDSPHQTGASILVLLIGTSFLIHS
jgi:hypothetical protein